MSARSEVAVIGAGIAGLCTAYALSERGVKAEIYERGTPGDGQSGGESRIFRHSHEDPRLVALACEARVLWRQWEERFGLELLSRDGVVAIGSVAEQRLSIMREAGVTSARRLAPEELGERLPLLASWTGPTVLDEDGGAIRTRASIDALTEALDVQLVTDEVLSLRVTRSGTVEVRAGGSDTEYERVVVCAGRGTAALARGAGLALPVRQAVHARFTFGVTGNPPERLACLLDSSDAFGEAHAYADPLPGNHAYAVGLYDTPVAEDGSVMDAHGLAASADRTGEYVARALPGLDPEPIGVRNCWVTELPWSPDGFAVWEAGGLLVLAGNHLFKHAPSVGRALAGAALGDGLPEDLRPEARLGSAEAVVPAE